MKQQSAASSRLWATAANASRKTTALIRKLWSFLTVLNVLMLSSALLMLGTVADNSSDARYNDLDHRMMCTCESGPANGMGLARCQQVLLE